MLVLKLYPYGSCTTPPIYAGVAKARVLMVVAAAIQAYLMFPYLSSMHCRSQAVGVAVETQSTEEPVVA